MLVILSIWDFPDVFKDYVRKWATKPTNYLLRWNYFHKNKHFDRKESFDWRWHDSKQKTFQNRLLRISASLMKSKHFLCGTDFSSFFLFSFLFIFFVWLNFTAFERPSLLFSSLYCLFVDSPRLIVTLKEADLGQVSRPQHYNQTGPGVKTVGRLTQKLG